MYFSCVRWRAASSRTTSVREEFPEDAAAEGTSPLEATIGAEALESYENALATLRDEERQAIVLRVDFGLDYDEIAAQLGKPSAAAARTTVTRAIARLADEMRRPRLTRPLFPPLFQSARQIVSGCSGWQ